MDCRPGCGACCIAPSISSPIPGMPGGKPPGERCAHLTPENLCGIYDRPDRPEVCCSLRAMPDICGNSSEEAMVLLAELEDATRPSEISPRRASREE